MRACTGLPAAASVAREWRAMKRILCLTLALTCYAAVSSAQSMGTVTENGIVMDVKAAVGVLDDGRLTVFLLPFQPTAAEIAKLQTDDSLWVLDKPPRTPRNGRPHRSGNSDSIGEERRKQSVMPRKRASTC